MEDDAATTPQVLRRMGYPVTARRMEKDYELLEVTSQLQASAVPWHLLRWLRLMREHKRLLGEVRELEVACEQERVEKRLYFSRCRRLGRFAGTVRDGRVQVRKIS